MKELKTLYAKRNKTNVNIYDKNKNLKAIFTNKGYSLSSDCTNNLYALRVFLKGSSTTEDEELG